MERLAWQNRHVKQLVQTLDVDLEASCEGRTPQVISGEDNVVILRVSFEEWKQLYSSLFTGADICYPETSDNVRWILQRAVECPVPICEMIIDCINTDPDVRSTIINMLLADEGFRAGVNQMVDGNALTPTEITGPVISECDEDKLFGAITSIVDYMDTNNRDLFELMEEGTNDEEKFALYIGAIPILETIPLDEIIDFSQDLIEDFAENYASSWTTEYRNEVRCALFCIAKDNPDCTLTFANIFDYFSERIGATTNLGSGLVDIINFIRHGSWGGTQVVDAMMLFQTGIWRTGGDYMNIDLYRLEVIAALGANNPDNDWAILPCPDCPPDGECIETVYDTSLGTHAGFDTGVHAMAGDKVTITAIGTYTSFTGAGSLGVVGFPGPQSAYLDPGNNPYSLMIQIQGEDFREWRVFTQTTDANHGELEFTAPVSGNIMVVVNEFYGSGPISHGEFADNVGSFDLEICVGSGPIELVKSSPGYILDYISSTDDEIVVEMEAVYTGHYTMGGAFEKNNRPFYILEAEVLSGTWGYNVYFAGSNWLPDEIPNNVAGTTISIGQGSSGVNIQPGARIRFTVSSEPGS